MQALSSVAYSLSRDLDRKNDLEENLSTMLSELESVREAYNNSLEAQRLLGVVADEKANQVLNYVTSVINKTLAEIFPHDGLSLALERKLHSGKYPHINVVLRTAEGKTRNLVTQSGTGLRQIIGFLYRLCLIEVTGSRKLVIMDELLGGVHKDAIVVIEDLMKIFVKGGFQFICVDYALSARLGMTYLVEKRGPVATVKLLEEDDDADTYNVKPKEDSE